MMEHQTQQANGGIYKTMDLNGQHFQTWALQSQMNWQKHIGHTYQ